MALRDKFSSNMGGWLSQMARNMDQWFEPTRLKEATIPSPTPRPTPTPLPAPAPAREEMISPLPEGTVPQGMPQQQPQPQANPLDVPLQQMPEAELEKIETAIVNGLMEYGANPKLIDFASKFAEATQRYPIFAKYPFLLPQMSIAETSAGNNITRENNPLNWGARVQAAGNYNPTSWEQSIEDAITAIGGEPNRGEPGSSRQRQIEYYEPFRQSEDLQDFANTYEPDNGDYYDILTKGFPLFEKYLGQ